MYDPMLAAIDKVFEKFPDFVAFRYPIYKRAAESVVEEEYHGDDEIHVVVMKQVKAADLTDERKEAFAAALTAAIAKTRDASRRREKQK